MTTANLENCDINRLGTGLGDCLAKLKYPIGFFLVKKTWSTTNDTVIDKAYILDNIQNGNFIPFVESFDYEQNTPETTFQEGANGKKRQVRNGLPEFTFRFLKTIQFQKIAYSYNSYDQYDVILLFNNNKLFLADDGTNYSGFNASYVNTNTAMFNDGSNDTMTPMAFQLTDNLQFNYGSVVGVGYSITSTNGVIDTLITDGSAVAGGDITVKVVFKANPAENVLGLGVDQFRVVLNGVAEVPSAVSYNDVNGTYAITPTSTTVGADDVVVELYDDANSVSVAKLGDLLFDGISDMIVVA